MLQRIFNKIKSSTMRGPLPALSVDEQLALLSLELYGLDTRGILSKLALRRLDDDDGNLGKQFTITKEQYLCWARSLPLSSFVGTEPGTFDSVYVIHADGRWNFYNQERGIKFERKEFHTEQEAKEYVIRDCSPNGIYWRLP